MSFTLAFMLTLAFSPDKYHRAAIPKGILPFSRTIKTIFKAECDESYRNVKTDPGGIAGSS